MPEALYDLAIVRHSSEKPVEQLVQDLFEIMEETGDPYLEYKLSESLLFEQSNNVILENITLAEYGRYQQLFLEHKVETRLQTATQAEKRTPENAQAEHLDTEQFYTDHDETELPHKKVRCKLSIKKKTQTAIAVAGVAVVLIAGAGYFAFEELDKNTEQDTRHLAANTNNNTAIGIQGKDAPLSQSKVRKSVVATELTNATTEPATTIPVSLSPQQLEVLTTILKSTGSKAFGQTDSDQYTKLLPKLKRLLELDKPDLGLVFAENNNDAYAAALLILEVANSERLKNRNQYHDDILLTMKNITVKADSKYAAPLLTSALSQVYNMTGDTTAAQVVLEKAIQEAENTAGTPEQNIQWLTRMLIDHQHFNHSAGAEKLVNKLESMADSASVDTPEGQLTISSIYSHLAGISIAHGDITGAAGWLKKIPAEDTRSHLQAYLDNL